MGLKLRDSETFGDLIIKRSIEIATKMYIGGMKKEKILYYTEITEEEFEKEVVNKVKKEN